MTISEGGGHHVFQRGNLWHFLHFSEELTEMYESYHASSKTDLFFSLNVYLLDVQDVRLGMMKFSPEYMRSLF